MLTCARSVVLNKCAHFCQFVITRFLSPFYNCVYVRGRSTSNLCCRHVGGIKAAMESTKEVWFFNLNIFSFYFCLFSFCILNSTECRPCMRIYYARNRNRIKIFFILHFMTSHILTTYYLVALFDIQRLVVCGYRSWMSVFSVLLKGKKKKSVLRSY